MRKIVFALPVIVTAGFLFTLVSFKEPHKQSIKTIIIDPGHGGLDPGARGLSSSEAASDA